MKPWVVSCCSTWVSAWELLDRGSVLEQRHRSPLRHRATSGTDGICIAWAICGMASMSTRPEEDPSSSSAESVCRSSASVTLSGERVGLSNASSTGAVREVSSSLLEVLLGHLDGVRAPPAGAPPAPTGGASAV